MEGTGGSEQHRLATDDKKVIPEEFTYTHDIHCGR